MTPYGMYPNPMNNYYQSYLQQSVPQPYNYSQPSPQVPQSPQYVVRQIGNIEEAKSFSVEPGCIYLFIDNANKTVYIKTMGNDGLSRFESYKRLEETSQIKVDPIQEVNQRLCNIENILGGMRNGKPYANDAVHAESHKCNATADTTAFQGTGPAEVPKHYGNGERKR